MSAGTLIRNDLRVQARNGFYAAYAFVAVSYTVVLRAAPPDVRALLLPPVLLSEAAVVGFFFAGAILHFERADGTLSALGVTPVGVRSYVFAKAASLSLLNVLVALAVVFGAGPGVVHVAPLIAGALLAAVFFALAGLAVAARFRSIERFVLLGGLATAALGLPALPYFGLLPGPLWSLLPTTGYLGFLARAVESPRANQGFASAVGSTSGFGAVAADALVLAAWCALAFLICTAWLDRYAIGRDRGRP